MTKPVASVQRQSGGLNAAVDVAQNLIVPGGEGRSVPAVDGGIGPSTILTVGLCDHDAYWLSRIDGADRFRFVPVGEFAEADNPELCRPRAFVMSAVAAVDRLVDPPSGVVAFDDYPASVLAAAIAERLGLPGPSLASVVACHNKAWSRKLQADIVPQAVPRFQVIDPHRTYRPHDLQLAFPFWLKPVKSSMSYLGFRIRSFDEFERALALARTGLPAYAAAFQEMMETVSPPDSGDAPDVRADSLIAEELLRGRQCTLEGFVYRNELTLVGIVDSIRLPNRVSFSRFEYPSRLPCAVQQDMIDIARRVLDRTGFDNGLFNIEYIVDKNGRPMIVEINPRFSPQFSDLFQKVDGNLSHQYVVELAAGQRPALARRRGRHRVAASCVLRVEQDCFVERVPTDDEIARLTAAAPDAHVQITTRAGQRLSDSVQDSYTFRYGLVHLGARDRRDLRAKLALAKRLLPFRLRPLT